MTLGWRLDADEFDSTVAPRPLLSTWLYLQRSLRRKWKACLAAGVLGVLAGLAAVAFLPSARSATVTILLAHPSDAEPAQAMATDVSFLNTREVATAVIHDLGLPNTSANDFQSTVISEIVTDQVLRIVVSAPSDQDAVQRTKALVREYLTFRNEQVRSLNQGIVVGYRKRITSLQRQVDELTKQYNALSQKGVGERDQAQNLLIQRTQLNSQISTMQQAIEEATLQTDAVVSSSRVIDPVHLVPRSAKKSAALKVVSGGVLGLGVGIGLVFMRALTSEQVRRRREVAVALGAPVLFSIPDRLSRLRMVHHAGKFLGQLGWTAGEKRPSAHGRGGLGTLVHGLEAAVEGNVRRSGTRGRVTPERSARSTPGVALAGLDDGPVAAVVLQELSRRLSRSGLSVFLVDLSASGTLEAIARRRIRRPNSREEDSVPVSVFRPPGNVRLAPGPIGTTGLRQEPFLNGSDRDAWMSADVTLALVELDSEIELSTLKSWVDRVIPLVTAGASTAEFLETVGELVRAAGLEVPFAMMMGVDRSDKSLGLIDFNQVPQEGTEQVP